MDYAFDEDLFEESSEETDTTESNPMRKLRKHANTLERKLKGTEKELEELKAWRAERETAERTARANEAFKAAGLDEKAAKLFRAVNPDADPTAEAVKTFATEYGLVKAPAEEQSETVETEEPLEEPTTSTGFEPMKGGEAPLNRAHSAEELAAMAKAGDFNALERAVAEIARDPRRLKLKYPSNE